MRKTSNRRPKRRMVSVLKPRGSFHPRVQSVGPEHFGIVAVDPAKRRSAIMATDYYGNILVEQFNVEQTRPALTAAIQRLGAELTRREIRDRVVAIERTGRYHHPVRDAFRDAGWDVRLVHPYATSHLRQPANPGNKTDGNDLAAIQRAAVAGWALRDEPLPENWARLQLLARYRRSIVEKGADLKIAIKEHLHAYMPGYSSLFADFWDTASGVAVARHFDAAEKIQQAGVTGLAQVLRTQGIRPVNRLLQEIVTWAASAPAPDVAAAARHEIVRRLFDDLTTKQAEICGLELELACELAQTPYVLLLSVPGVGVVSAVEYAAEAGPIERYASSKAIAGRAGLYPCRYQSDETDHADGALVRVGNHRLRAALMTLAFCLSRSNVYFGQLTERWKLAGVKPLARLVRVANRFARISYHMLAAQSPFRHPLARERDYVLTKLLRFCLDHEADPEQTRQTLLPATGQIEAPYRGDERVALAAMLTEQQKRRRGPQPLGEVLPAVIAKLEVQCSTEKHSASEEPSNEPS